ncbi:hypothetical protein COHA_001069 [Chlorella ohadii]|uniref:Uncharacterized protein n=1 Tax=Chlorella ohadii TaxID=2649997 RepID=A0AAD5H9L8_9CHLO|nr:hypothetical protein COHA_001069 [Chlorella ohadii]
MTRDGAPARRPSFAPPRRQPQQRSGFPEQPEAAATASPASLELNPYRTRSFLDQPDNVKDFATLQAMMEEIQANIALRQDTISLLTGEVTRLKGQMQSAQGLSSDNGSYSSNSHAAALPAPVSNGRAAAAAALPPAVSFPTPSFSAPAAASPLPSVFSGDGKKDVGLYGASVAAVVFFAGVVAPVLEDKVGLGGPAYYDFIASRGLPTQMAEVDPIIASHAGGAVGIMTAQLLSSNKRRQ